VSSKLVEACYLKTLASESKSESEDESEGERAKTRVCKVTFSDDDSVNVSLCREINLAIVCFSNVNDASLTYVS